MGYMGLDVWAESDMAADMAHTVFENMVKDLRHELVSEKGNQYNTDGPVNVALFFEAFLLPLKDEVGYFEGLQDLAKDTIVRIGYKIKEADEADWGSSRDDKENKNMHVSAYKRMLNSLNEFVQSA